MYCLHTKSYNASLIYSIDGHYTIRWMLMSNRSMNEMFPDSDFGPACRATSDRPSRASNEHAEAPTTALDAPTGRRFLMAGGIATAAVLLTPQARAQFAEPTRPTPLPHRTQVPLLTISGNVGITNEENAAVFDRPMLEALAVASITTTTPWYDGPVRFDGVPMVKVLEAVGAKGTTLTAIALNDYSTDIPIDDFARFDVLLATRRGGTLLQVSDRGPLFIIYPYDSNPVLRSRIYYSRSAWSVAQLIIQ
jgi:hypothetical protein